MFACNQHVLLSDICCNLIPIRLQSMYCPCSKVFTVLFAECEHRCMFNFPTMYCTQNSDLITCERLLRLYYVLFLSTVGSDIVIMGK